MTRRSKTIMWIVIAVLAVIIISVLFSDMFDNTKDIIYSEFYNKIEAGEITEIKIDNFIWTGKEYDPITQKNRYKAKGYSVLAFTDHELIVDHSELDDTDFLTITGMEYGILEKVIIFPVKPLNLIFLPRTSTR